LNSAGVHGRESPCKNDLNLHILTINTIKQKFKTILFKIYPKKMKYFGKNENEVYMGFVC
jgi:hypothetical protein